MKLRHLFLTLILAALLAVSAAAYQVPNRETNQLSPYYGMNTDQEDQADFLKALGLFRGTNNGYELDRSMNRCEAGTMLVRLLGKEAEALEENNGHPFTDVPAWADPYVGWLWKNGLTKGMDETTYGAKKAVTAEQYLIFLSRVLQGSDVADDWWKTGFGYEVPALKPPWTGRASSGATPCPFQPGRSRNSPNPMIIWRSGLWTRASSRKRSFSRRPFPSTTPSIPPTPKVI